MCAAQWLDIYLDRAVNGLILLLYLSWRTAWPVLEAHSMSRVTRIDIRYSTMPVVATGFWINHDSSPALGAILTLKTADANILLTSLTFIMTIAFACVWHITAFSIHHCLSSRSPTEVLDLQHRVLLRNKGGVFDTVLALTKLYSSWKRRHPTRLLRKTLKLILPCILIFVASIASSIFISKVTSSRGAAVRVVPSLCGLYSLSDLADESDQLPADAIHWHLAKGIDAARRARTYVSAAYLNESRLETLQPIFWRRTLPYTVSATAPCPFPNATRCSLGENGALLISSGIIDSHHMLGINAPPDSRISFQQNMTCSPLNVDDLITISGSTIRLNMGRRSRDGNGSYPYESTAAIFLEPDSTSTSYSFSS